MVVTKCVFGCLTDSGEAQCAFFFCVVARCIFVWKVISKIMVNECKRGEEIDFFFFLVTIDDKFVV